MCNTGSQIRSGDSFALRNDGAEPMRRPSTLETGSRPVPGSPWYVHPPTQFPTDWASAFGQDPYGLWCGIEVGEVRQRLRWIPPGEFLMGSAPNEEARRGDETLHRVTLTRGYWLAETACTQALWKAVTGNNPSRFKSAERPVEQVTWKDVQNFIARLNHRVAGLGARLPTEAEWEYAARAGTQTAFWWGDELTVAQANYNGNYPYPAGAQKGEFRNETVSVKMFDANPWGLFQVHGNVFEWCQSAYGAYPLGVQESRDPKGPSSGVKRVQRGGGWFDGGQHLRAAARSGIDYDIRGVRGFRLAAG